MRQFLHLFIVDPALRTAVTTTAGGRRLLPIIVAPETSRVSGFVSRWLQQRAMVGQPVGQWLGRVLPDAAAADWLVPVQATERSAVLTSSGLQWTDLETIKAFDWHLEYQQWAVARLLATSDLPSVPGPFGRLTWQHGVREWIRQALGEGPRARIALSARRLSSHEVVLECRTAYGRWFFKGLSADRILEVAVTSAMSQLMPESFARSVASTTVADGSVWWLIEACPGKPLNERLTSDHVVRVVEAYAHIQQVVTRQIVNTGCVSLPRLDLAGLAAWSTNLVEEAPNRPDSPGGRAAIEQACAEVGFRAPLSWVAADLDPSNAIVAADEVRFIDLDDALIGPAPLAIATFARRLERSTSSQGCRSTSTIDVIDVYERAWAPRLDVYRRWRSLELVSDCLECSLAWRRAEARTDRGEVYGVREVLRPAIRRRLLRAIDRYQASTPLI